MWMTTSKGRFVRQPSASEIVGALIAMSEDDAMVVARNLMQFVYVARLAQGFRVWIRDGSLARQACLDHGDPQDVASALIAFATHASFCRDIVDAMTRPAAA
jgi:hypothetical protein